MKGFDSDCEEQFFDEKSSHGGSPSSQRKQSVIKGRLIALLVTLLLITISGNLLSPCPSMTRFMKSSTMKNNDTMEVFELTLPILHTNEVRSDVILEHEFGNSWGRPAVVSITPPKDIEFNRVVLTLNMSVSGVQYDRLAHIFIDDIPIWRTSTPEPGHDTVVSSASKDISKYLPLFQRDELELVFELNNLISGKLTGVIKTSLTVTYFNEENDDDADEITTIFRVTNKPSHRVTQLIEHAPNRTPLLYFPDKPLVFNVPKISQNTTTLKVALYASGNAAEEFWYSNVLDDYKKKFIKYGHELLGHGPVRVVNIYLNDILVDTVAPEPVIYSGGISPALWRPVIGINAFDIKPLEIDLTAFLPELWKGKGSQLKVEITNGEDARPHVGENWIVSANLLHWESPKIESCIGELISYENSSSYNSFGLSTDPSNLYQNVLANKTASLWSNITVNLANGTQLPFKVHTSSVARFSNFQQYKSFGDSQFVSSLVSSTFNSMVFLNEEVVVNSLRATKVHPQVISLLSAPVIDRNVTFDANVTTIYGSTISLNEKEVFTLESNHKGTSTYTLSPFGNYGFGSASQNFVAHLKAPFPHIKVDELVEAVNGTVTRRESGDLDNDTAFDLETVDPKFDGLVEHLKALREERVVDDSIMTKFLKEVVENDNVFNCRNDNIVENDSDRVIVNIGRHL